MKVNTIHLCNNYKAEKTQQELCGRPTSGRIQLMKPDGKRMKHSEKDFKNKVFFVLRAGIANIQ